MGLGIGVGSLADAEHAAPLACEFQEVVSLDSFVKSYGIAK